MYEDARAGDPTARAVVLALKRAADEVDEDPRKNICGICNKPQNGRSWTGFCAVEIKLDLSFRVLRICVPCCGYSTDEELHQRAAKALGIWKAFYPKEKLN